MLANDRGQGEAISAGHDTLHAECWKRLAPLEGAADLLRARAHCGWAYPMSASLLVVD